MTQQGSPAPAMHSEAPVPPRSRRGVHLLGLALAAIGGPITFGALAIAIEMPAQFGEQPSLHPFPVVLACVGLAATTFATMRSSVGAAIAGGAWFVAGILGLLLPGQAETLLRLVPETALGGAPRAGATLLLQGGGALALGCTLGGTAIAATIARRRGHIAERSERAAIDSGDVTRPPLSRVLAHILAPVLSFLLAVLGLQILSGTETVALWSASSPQDPLAGPVPWLVTVGALIVATLGPAMLGAWSSLGPAAATLVWLVAAVDYLVAAVDLSWWSPGNGPASLLAPASPEVTAWAAHAAGLSLAVGAALGGAALGIHFARRDGAAHARREHRIALRRATAS